MKVTLGKPVHGWVDLSIRDRTYFIADSISDVPTDFVDQIVSAISLLLTTGREQQTILGLEPNYYLLTFRCQKGLFSFTFEKEFEQPSPSSRKLLHRSEGSFSEILRPFIEAVQKFYNDPVNEPHWPKCDADNIVNLTKVADNYI